MKQNAYERLRANHAVTLWWQSVLNSEEYALVIEAAKNQLEQNPPAFPPGTNPVETMALSFSAGLGVKAALDMLDKLGSETLTQERIAEEQHRKAQAATAPASAGTGPGRMSPPPPEIAPPPPATPNA